MPCSGASAVFISVMFTLILPCDVFTITEFPSTRSTIPCSVFHPGPISLLSSPSATPWDSIGIRSRLCLTSPCCVALFLFLCCPAFPASEAFLATKFGGFDGFLSSMINSFAFIIGLLFQSKVLIPVSQQKILHRHRLVSLLAILS